MKDLCSLEGRYVMRPKGTMDSSFLHKVRTAHACMHACMHVATGSELVV